jgi:hypothetical protein
MEQNIKKIEDNKYSAQALAIAMVVLVVSSLIAMSVYSRTSRDKSMALEERASAEALEVSDLILDKIMLYNAKDLVEAVSGLSRFSLEEVADYTEGVVLKENDKVTDITELFRSVNILEADEVLSDLVDPLCPINVGTNEYQLTVKEMDHSSYYEIRSGHVWSLPVKNLMEANLCLLNLKLTVRGDSRAGFSVIKKFCRYDVYGEVVDCEEFNPEDPDKDHFTNYCFSSGNLSSCNNTDFVDSDNWIKYNPDDKDNEGIELEIERRLVEVGEGGDPVTQAPTEYQLSEIRVKAIGGTIGISYYLPEDCLSGFRMYQLRATANCQGVYRGKEILIPEAKWYNVLFDYVLFNGEGSM